jgi:hypothetical protein
MDNGEIYFDEIKREVLPDGRIRYYAEKIVHEVETEVPRTENEIAQLFAKSAECFRTSLVEHIAFNNPYITLLEGSARGGKPV